MGSPLISFFTQSASQVKLRLATSTKEKQEALQQSFPMAEVVEANYLDLSSLKVAVSDMEGIFVVTPSAMDERQPMENLVKAVKEAKCAIHIIRVVGLLPEMNHSQITPGLKAHGLGIPIQHPIARKILEESGLPVTFLNIAATFIDNFLQMRISLRHERRVVYHNRLVPFLDPSDAAEVAARLFLSDNHRHIGQFHSLNNNTDLIRCPDIARIFSEAWDEPLGFSYQKEDFFRTYQQLGMARLNYLWEFLEFEQTYEVAWSLNNFGELMLGRKLKTVREWAIENRKFLLEGE